MGMKKHQYASELIDKLLGNKLSKEELDQLLDGLGDKGTEDEYTRRLRTNYNRIMAEHLAQHEIDVRPISSEHKKSKTVILSRKLMRWAAVFALVIGLFYSFKYVVREMERDLGRQVAQETGMPDLEKITKEGTWAKMNFSDGSFIHMNAGSKLVYPRQFASEERTVSLDGEAYFNIKHEIARPFFIKAKDVTIEVLGTSFDVKAYDNEGVISVTVETGRVKVDLNKNSDKSIYLSKDQKLEYKPATGSYQVIDVEASRELSWRNGILYFDQTPFVEVKHTIERWYGVHITVGDTAIINKRISGEHKNENLVSVLEALKYALNVDYKIDGKNITLQ